MPTSYICMRPGDSGVVSGVIVATSYLASMGRHEKGEAGGRVRMGTDGVPGTSAKGHESGCVRRTLGYCRARSHPLLRAGSPRPSMRCGEGAAVARARTSRRYRAGRRKEARLAGSSLWRRRRQHGRPSALSRAAWLRQAAAALGAASGRALPWRAARCHRSSCHARPG
eukprot:scaffold98373_cov26-Tisochrysis_lutea.AAC.3